MTLRQLNTTNMKDYNERITYDSLTAIVNHAFINEYHIDIREGVLNDTYIIHNEDRTLSLKGVKPRKYIILYPQFATEWSNSFHVLMTDNEQTMQDFAQLDEA